MNRTTRTALAALMLTAAPVVALAQGTSGTDMTTGGTGTTTGATTGTTTGTTAGDMATGSTAGSTDAMPGSANTGTTTTYGSPTTGSTATDSTSTMGGAAATGGMGSTATDTGSSTSGTSSTAASGSGDSQVLAEVEKPAKGNARQRTAETQRALLNRFSQLGFADVREFRREGETYITEAKTAEGDWVSVVLDPESGTIVQRK